MHDCLNERNQNPTTWALHAYLYDDQTLATKLNLKSIKTL
jgi:hypothetical protein